MSPSQGQGEGRQGEGRAPQVLVVMGVSGSGKSTVAALVAERLGWPFVDGDSFHSPANIAKMHAGHALDDGDRAPWLAAIAGWIAQRLAQGESGVVVCSALRRSYRDLLTRGHPAVRIVFLDGSQALVARRLAERKGHFMSPGLLDSQFETLEPPGRDEHPITVGIEDPPERVAERIVAAALRGAPVSRPDIGLVVADVDGTLVTDDKRLTGATVRAAQRLDAAGIAFTVVSSRPPVGLRALVEPLRLRLPMGAFNGASIVRPDLSVIEERLIPEDAAREAVDRLLAAGLDAWVFARGAWCLRDPRAPYADLERRTLDAEPEVVDDLGPLLDKASKIVGVGTDPAGLAACEEALGSALARRASVHRSQAYYLDVTPPGVDKGAFVAWIARHLGLPEARVLAIGDGRNDRPMFARGGHAVAMGNADEAVRAAAGAVTASNEADGFAEAVERFILS